MRKQFKIVHIHSDHKFYHNIGRYQNEFFDNKLLILGRESTVNIHLQKDAIFFEPTTENIDRIVEYVSDFDMVVFANLTFYNRKLLLKLPVKLKVIWWFFGHEFYSSRLDLTLSPTSIEASKKDYKVRRKRNLREFLSFYKYKYQQARNYRVYSKKIDAILMYSEEEYRFVKKEVLFLPPLLIPPIGNPEKDRFTLSKKKDYIILGHSRNVNNNHLDILSIIKSNTSKNRFRVKMFLSYGHEKNYYQKVISEIENIPVIEPIYDFLPKEDFNRIYCEASAIVINSYRQMALANIFTAIRNNCKVYLNDRNIVKKWLTRQGMKIYSISDFEKDYFSNNLKLTDEEAEQNWISLQGLISNNSNKNFYENLLKILKSR